MVQEQYSNVLLKESLAAVMEHTRLTKHHWAKLAGVSYNTLNNLFNNKVYELSYSTLDKLAQAVNMSVEQLVYFSVAEEKKEVTHNNSSDIDAHTLCRLLADTLKESPNATADEHAAVVSLRYSLIKKK